MERDIDNIWQDFKRRDEILQALAEFRVAPVSLEHKRKILSISDRVPRRDRFRISVLLPGVAVVVVLLFFVFTQSDRAPLVELSEVELGRFESIVDEVFSPQVEILEMTQTFQEDL